MKRPEEFVLKGEKVALASSGFFLLFCFLMCPCFYFKRKEEAESSTKGGNLPPSSKFAVAGLSSYARLLLPVDSSAASEFRFLSFQIKMLSVFLFLISNAISCIRCQRVREGGGGGERVRTKHSLSLPQPVFSPSP